MLPVASTPPGATFRSWSAWLRLANQNDLVGILEFGAVARRGLIRHGTLRVSRSSNGAPS